VLTPEIAVAIEMAAREGESAPIDLQAFGSLEHGEYLIAAERFADVLPELHPMHAAHWAETEKHRHRIEFNPDYAAVIAMERAGRCLQFTVRHRGALVGNLRMYLMASVHTRAMYAIEDTIFIYPEHRGGFLSIALVRFMERAVRSLGVSEIRMTTKLVNKADVLLRRLNYQPVALEFVKFLKESP
jgi:GNAT superfamily N-acetyltransferase